MYLESVLQLQSAFQELCTLFGICRVLLCLIAVDFIYIPRVAWQALGQSLPRWNEHEEPTQMNHMNVTLTKQSTSIPKSCGLMKFTVRQNTVNSLQQEE